MLCNWSHLYSSLHKLKPILINFYCNAARIYIYVHIPDTHISLNIIQTRIERDVMLFLNSCFLLVVFSNISSVGLFLVCKRDLTLCVFRSNPSISLLFSYITAQLFKSILVVFARMYACSAKGSRSSYLRTNNKN